MTNFIFLSLAKILLPTYLKTPIQFSVLCKPFYFNIVSLPITYLLYLLMISFEKAVVFQYIGCEFDTTETGNCLEFDFFFGHTCSA